VLTSFLSQRDALCIVRNITERKRAEESTMGGEAGRLVTTLS